MRSQFIPIEKLRSHERFSRTKMRKIARGIKKSKSVRPLLVEKDYFIILDGYHRFAALQSLGFANVPVILLDYFSDKIEVKLRRKDIYSEIVKKSVLGAALSKKLFPEKTTRHVVKNLKKFPEIKL